MSKPGIAARSPDSIKGLWESYSTEVVPPDAGPIQRTECQRAFYGGCACFLGLLMDVLDGGLEPTAADLALMDRLASELRDFAANTTNAKPPPVQRERAVSSGDLSKAIPEAHYLEVPERVDVFSWTPEPPGTPDAKSTQVHLHCGSPPGPVFVMRFKGPRTLDQIIAALIKHRIDVWPDLPTEATI